MPGESRSRGKITTGIKTARSGASPSGGFDDSAIQRALQAIEQKLAELDQRLGELEQADILEGKHLSLQPATENIFVRDAGSTGATVHRWIELEVGGTTTYIQTHSVK